MSTQPQDDCQHLTATAASMPIPSVLVVGNRDSYFGKEAWRRIKDAYSEQSVNFGALPQKDVEDPASITAGTVEKNTPRTKGPSLYPFFLHDRGQTQSIDFQDSLQRIFYYLDVWAVISCGSAGTTEGLMRALAPVDIPLFITVDSTLSDRSRFNPSFLQLIPNNTLQAQAILGKVKMLFDKQDDTNKRFFEVFFDRRNDEYVVDLINALSSYCREIETNFSLGEVSNPAKLKAKNGPGIVVCIGYYEMMEKLMGLESSQFIMSDGCYDDRVTKILQRKTNTYFWAHTLSEPADYAQDAYLAICDTWRVMTMENRELSVGKSRLEQFLSLVRERLETRLPSRYKFVGEGNQRGGYVVEEVPAAGGKATKST